MELQAFLLEQLWARDVRQVFGIPGDYALNLYEAFERDGRFQLVRLSHEPSVGFAADGCARMTGGLGVCCVTYGAGGLNMVNPVACAYAEESPLVVLSGGPGTGERRAGIHVHHEVKSFDSQLKVYEEVTEYAAILDDPQTAAARIMRALDTAAACKRPVYLEIPRDMVFAAVTPPAERTPWAARRDEGAVGEAVAEIVSRLRRAVRPVLIVGVEVHRFDLREPVIRLAVALGVPVASSFLGRGVFPTRHPQFAGTYLGLASPPPLRQVVEDSDCVLLLGERISDTSLGVSAHCLSERNLLICLANDVFVGHHRYEHTPLERVVTRLTGEIRRTTPPRPPSAPIAAATPNLVPDPEAPITVAGVIDVLNEFADAHPDVPLVADTGDALFASVDIRMNECVAPAYYATMGFAVPAALGTQIATRRRPIVLVGDGAFQMTGPEIAHAAEYLCNPVIVLLNNTRWAMLQAFFPNARYNTTVPWPFAKLMELWGGRGFEAQTVKALRAALGDAWRERRATLIEVPLSEGDISPVLRRFVAAFQERLQTAQ
jgi:indolepyruvate decarboxylase